MIKIQKGSTRTAIILFNFIVLKFPTFFGYTSRLELFRLKETLKSEGFGVVWKEGLIRKQFRKMWESFMLGISANISEGWLWLMTKSTFLNPTLCLIIFNIQRYKGEHLPTWDQLEPLRQSIPEERRGELLLMGSHHLNTDNWRIVDSRLVLIDYGGRLFDFVSFPGFIWRWKDQIEKGLSKPVT